MKQTYQVSPRRFIMLIGFTIVITLYSNVIPYHKKPEPKPIIQDSVKTMMYALDN